MRRIVILVLAVVGYWAEAQIVDDSTKQVYSAKTTNIIFQRGYKDNLVKERHPDTTLYNLEKFTVLDINNRMFQDLGTNGTAMYPIFYPVQNTIGRTDGLSAYNVYAKSPDNFKYYDTKSPFMDVNVVFGGEGRSLADFTFTQNKDENFNFGFDIYRITSAKQIGKISQQDHNVVATSVDAYINYKHSTLPYRALAYIYNSAFNINETGGIYVANLENATRADLFKYQDAPIRLDDAITADKRFSLHLYHQYNWTKPLQFYHQFDIENHSVYYRDKRPTDLFYSQFLIDPDSTYANNVWKEVRNEIGIKGDLANIFYRLYIKRRDLNFDMLYTDPTDKFSEMYLGGYTRFDWREKFDVEASTELMQSGEYKLIGSLNSELLFGSYKTVRYKPSFMSESYFGNHHEWNQTFTSAFTNEIKGGVKLKLGPLLMKPQLRLITMDRFIYYDQNIVPQQSEELALLSSLGGNVGLTLYTNKTLGERFVIENEVYLTKLSGEGARYMSVPEVFYNGRYFWTGWIFKNTMGVELGVDLHAKSAYYAMDYAPEIQQFYLQNEFQINKFYTVDAFLNLRVSNVRVFLKMTNANQTSNNGYFVSPYYPGQFRVFDFGVRWLFFD